MTKARLYAIPRKDGRVAVAREKVIFSKLLGDIGSGVLVPVMLFQTAQAANLWIDGQAEVAVRGDWAGYAEDVAVADASEDTFALG